MLFKDYFGSGFTGGDEQNPLSIQFKGNKNTEQAVNLLRAYMEELDTATEPHSSCVPLQCSVSGAALLSASEEVRCELAIIAAKHVQNLIPVFATLDNVTYPNANTLQATVIGSLFQTTHALYFVQTQLLLEPLVFSQNQIVDLFDCWAGHFKTENPHGYLTMQIPDEGLISAVERTVASSGYCTGLNASLTILIKRFNSYGSSIYRRKAQRLANLGSENSDICIYEGEAWSDVAIADLNAAASDIKTAWCGLFMHCATASSGKPSSNWKKKALMFTAVLGKDGFAQAINKWFALVDLPRTQPLNNASDSQPSRNDPMVDQNADVLKGLVWVCGALACEATAEALGKAALSTYRKVPGVGPRNTKVGNACIWALGQIPSDTALSELAMLKVKVKFKPAQKGILAALAIVADRLGVSAQDLEELGVPEYGLTGVGVRKQEFGEFSALMTIGAGAKIDLLWRGQSGKSQKSIPKSVREHHADKLKALRQAGKDSVKMLSALRERLDHLMVGSSTWAYQQWLDRYLNHVLHGVLARRLIWVFEFEEGLHSTPQVAIWRNDHMVDCNDNPLPNLERALAVSLWHPINATRQEIVQWRGFVENHGIVQPFKQAHREIYLLTDAERASGVYSNRFASHIIKQHQFNALSASRHWHNTLRLMVDDEYPPAIINLPEYDLRAEFWIEGLGEEYGADTTEAGSYLYLVTDQVRFYPMDAAVNSAHAGGGGYRNVPTSGEVCEPFELGEIPALVLSEVLRDVDLFIGVASVGNDPAWSDGGREGRYVDYWRNVSFGELSESAKTRKVVFEKLLPKLKIRDVCSIENQFLIVTGKLHTYRIHLGSGNVLMQPNDQYLCIVSSQGVKLREGTFFLPFEGDGRTSVILSKAFLLAEDDKITDPTIVSQLL